MNAWLVSQAAPPDDWFGSRPLFFARELHVRCWWHARPSTCWWLWQRRGPPFDVKSEILGTCTEYSGVVVVGNQADFGLGARHCSPQSPFCPPAFRMLGKMAMQPLALLISSCRFPASDGVSGVCGCAALLHADAGPMLRNTSAGGCVTHVAHPSLLIDYVARMMDGIAFMLLSINGGRRITASGPHKFAAS